MARERRSARKTVPPHRILVVSLLAREITAAEPWPGVTTRARSRRIAAAVAALPEEILAWEIFVRLPAKDILRCRAVCRYWRGLASAPDFLLAHHRRQPPLLLLTQYGIHPIFEGAHLVVGLQAYHNCFKIKASCDGLLLLSDGRFSICNPVTRQCAPLPCLTDTHLINTAALYLHRPSGEYRILYWKRRHPHDHLEAAYYIHMVRQGSSPRCIGVPSHTPGIEKAKLAWNETSTTNLAPPVVFRNCLHWDPECLSSYAGILVFDTVVESFRLMRLPAAATSLCTRVCDMDGSIGFSCFGDYWRKVVQIWVLEDYEREVWSFKYHVKYPVGRSFYHYEHIQHWVLSHKGDVLIYNRCRRCMFHCDNTGKLLEEFQCDPRSASLIGPWFRESLVKYESSLRPGPASVGQLRFFERV